MSCSKLYSLASRSTSAIFIPGRMMENICCEEWGIGFRLEDNCLVTEDSCENLTASIPRTIEEIESVMGGE